jgi:hypothetical protein
VTGVPRRGREVAHGVLVVGGQAFDAQLAKRNSGPLSTATKMRTFLLGPRRLRQPVPENTALA